MASDNPFAPGTEPVGVLRRWWRAIPDEVRDWSRGRAWWPRALGLALMAWLVVRQLDGGFYNTPLSAIDLGIHEAGHLLVRFAGEFVMIAAGSGFQILAPLVAGALFIRQRDWFAVAVCLFWAGVSTGEVGTYAGDAVAQAMPLVSVGGGDVQHDWAALLERTGLLDSTATVAGLIHLVAVLLQAAGLAAGGWITWLMWSTRGQEPDGD